MGTLRDSEDPECLSNVLQPFCTPALPRIGAYRAGRARAHGFPVHQVDLHFLDGEGDFDAIYSSHALEHMLAPDVAIAAVAAMLKPGGLLFVALPYPDVAAADPENGHRFKAHCGSMPLGLHEYDNARSTRRVFERHGFRLVNRTFDDRREPEVWLTFEKHGPPGYGALPRRRWT